MDLYNVRVTSFDGTTSIVEVFAPNISEARREAERQNPYSRVMGVPTRVTQASRVAPTRVSPDVSGVGSDSFSSFVGGLDSSYNPSAYGIQNSAVSIPNPIHADLTNQLGFGDSQANTGSNTPQFSSMYGGQYPGNYDPMAGGEKRDYDLAFMMLGGASPLGYNPAPGSSSAYNEVDEADKIERFRQLSLSNPVAAGFDNQNQIGEEASLLYDIDAEGIEKYAAEARQRAQDEMKEKARQASLLNGPVRSWDAKLGDITVNADGSVTLPVDMWRNSDSAVGSGDQPIGREQIEDAIRRIAEIGGRDNLNRSVSNMLQQARTYYSNTSRGRNTWDKNIDSGLIDGKLLADAGFKATWGDLADEILSPREEDIESQVPVPDLEEFDDEMFVKDADIESKVPDAWANNPDGYNSLSEIQKEAADVHNLTSMSEVEAHYTAEQAKQLSEFDDQQYIYDVGEGVGLPDLKEFDDEMFVANPPPVFGPQAGTVGVPAWSSQDMIDDEQGFLTGAGQRLAFRNVFGEPATGVGPLASYLQRQTNPLTQAYRAQTFADMGRQEAGKYVLAPDAYPKVSFENFLTSVRDRPTGLGGAYGQALQNVDYLRGLSGSQVPTALAGVFSPEQAANTRDARALLQAAQRGKYSGLVSRSFRRPTEDDLFSDYVLAKQDASTAGTAPQNFLNFAASRYGL